MFLAILKKRNLNPIGLHNNLNGKWPPVTILILHKEK